MSTCSLCDLPTPKTPVTAADIDGRFCCRGCLEVHRSLANLEGVDRSDLDRQTGEQTDRTVPEDAEETFLAVDGMHCATCEGFLSLLGERETGIQRVEASYATDTARVVYDPDEVGVDELPDRLSGYGYTTYFRDDESDSVARRRDHDLVQRLLIGSFFTMLIMPWYLVYLYPSYVGIETGILEVDATSPVGVFLPLSMLGLMTTVVLFYTGYPVLRGAYVSLRVGRPNMDLLVALAAVAAYAYSTVALATGNTHLYYDVTVAVIMVVSLGTYYERRIKRRATDLLSELTAARSREATRRTAEGTETVAIDDLEPDDEVVVRPGERVPVDGTILEGAAAVDESVLTGESLPVTRSAGDDAIGGSVVTDSALVIEVGPDAESTIDRIATLLWEIQSESPGVQRFADKLATIFVPLVILLATVVTTYRLTTGAAPSDALLTGLTVLVVSCPCAMGLATPLAIAGGLRDALERGIIVTNAALFESAPAVDTLVFDKTGTLTSGEMEVRSIAGEDRALERAAAVERYSEHPAAAAITAYASEIGRVSDETTGTHGPARADGGTVSTQADAGRTVETDAAETAEALETDDTVSAFERHPGAGVSAVVDGERVVVGTPDLVERRVGPVVDELEAVVEDARGDGHLPVVIGYDGRARAVAVVGDRERTEWEAAVSVLDGRELVVLTGDDESAAEPFREHPAIDRVFAGVPPDGKVETVRRLSADGVTTMVGDGTNDAPALAAADLGIALGNGTAQAADAADAIVSSSDLRDVETVFELAEGTRRRIRENVGWALLYNAIAIPLAAVGMINPLFAALAMAASSIIVVTNSSRSVLEEE